MNERFRELKAQKKLSQQAYRVKSELILLGILPRDPEMTVPAGIVECVMTQRQPPDFGEWADPIRHHHGEHDIRVLEDLLVRVQDFRRLGYFSEEVSFELQNRVAILKEK
ncbi:hypothetical protein ACIMOF_04155 [Escherichia coli]